MLSENEGLVGIYSDFEAICSKKVDKIEFKVKSAENHVHFFFTDKN